MKKKSDLKKHPWQKKLIARGSYKSFSGDKNAIGDGLVPFSSSLLKGSQHIILSETVIGGFLGTIGMVILQKCKNGGNK